MKNSVLRFTICAVLAAVLSSISWAGNPPIEDIVLHHGGHGIIRLQENAVSVSACDPETLEVSCEGTGFTIVAVLDEYDTLVDCVVVDAEDEATVYVNISQYSETNYVLILSEEGTDEWTVSNPEE